MKKCKIEVIKTTFDEKLAEEYSVTQKVLYTILGKYFMDFAKPDNFCDAGWKAIINMYSLLVICHITV